MARLLVLGYDSNAFKYRGIDRSSFPTITNSDEEDKAINDAFEELQRGIDYLNQEGPFISELKLAEKVAKVYSLNKSGQLFEVVEIVYPFEEPKSKKAFLGYDILVKDEGFDSILSYLYNDKSDLQIDQKKIRENFAEKLNPKILLSNLNDAFSFYQKYGELLIGDLKLMILGIYN